MAPSVRCRLKVLSNKPTRRCTALCHPLRGLLGEYSVTIRQGIASVRRTLPETLAAEANGVPALVRQMAWRQYER
jgi:hypothetical protein